MDMFPQNWQEDDFKGSDIIELLCIKYLISKMQTAMDHNFE